jgi:hypothetical protein
MPQPKQEAKVIAGFPGVGKTHFISPSVTKPSTISNLIFNDLDSTPFSHTHGPPNPEFPGNYITHIQSLLSIPNLVIMVGVHDVVRDRLVENGIQFTLVYPEKGLKEEYMKRWTDRGSPKGLINKLDQMWDNFTSSCMGQKGCKHLVLKEGQYLSDVMEGIVNGEGVQK